MNVRSLDRLADELERVAVALRARDAPEPPARPVSAGATGSGLPDRELAMRLYRERRGRDRVLEGAGLAMAEPGWDMLLLLYAMHGAERPLTVSSVIEAGGIPATTGLRHLQMLQEAGAIRRTSDAHDRRRTLVTLSDHGLTLMRLVLEAVRAADRARAVL